MRRLVPISLLGVALLVACGEAPVTGDASTTTSSAAPTTQPDPTTTTTEGEVTPPTIDPTEAAIADLAGRLTVSTDQITLVETRAVTWPDGALGCPEEGGVYTQATVEGTQIVLQVDNRVFDYHAGDDGAPFLCPSDEKDGGYDFVPPPGFDN